MSTSEALSCSTRVSSSAINKQGGSDYYKVLPMGTRQDNACLYSCCGVTCSSAPARRSSLHVLDFIVILGEGAIKF
jgi:hypothetical protein